LFVVPPSGGRVPSTRACGRHLFVVPPSGGRVLTTRGCGRHLFVVPPSGGRVLSRGVPHRSQGRPGGSPAGEAPPRAYMGFVTRRRGAQVADAPKSPTRQSRYGDGAPLWRRRAGKPETVHEARDWPRDRLGGVVRASLPQWLLPPAAGGAIENPISRGHTLERAAEFKGVHGPSQGQELVDRLWQSPRTIMVGKALQRGAGLFVAPNEQWQDDTPLRWLDSSLLRAFRGLAETPPAARLGAGSPSRPWLPRLADPRPAPKSPTTQMACLIRKLDTRSFLALDLWCW